MKYRTLKYKTLSGYFDKITLSNQEYGDWIIYNGDIPKYHISLFRIDSKSDSLIKEFLDSPLWDIESLISKIGDFHSMDLNFGKPPYFKFKISDKIEEYELNPFPYEKLIFLENGKPTNFGDERVQFFYKNPDYQTDIEFNNRTGELINIWVEPSCQEIDLEKGFEYKVLTHDKSFRIEFDIDNQIIFYLQHSFGFKLYKREYSSDYKNQKDWILEDDTSMIN